MDQFIIAALIPALQLDSLSNSHPVSVTVQDPGEIGELFDTISYSKVRSPVSGQGNEWFFIKFSLSEANQATNN